MIQFKNLLLTYICLLTLPSCKHSWLRSTKQEIDSKKGVTLKAKDKLNKSILFNCKQIYPNSNQGEVSDLSTVYASAFTSIAVQLLKKHPEVIKTIGNYKPFQTYIDHVGWEKVNWTFVEEKIYQVNKEDFYNQIEKTCRDGATSIIIVAKDHATYNVLGFLLFTISPDNCNIHVHSLAFKPEAQHRGLGKLIISSIFKLIPKIEKITLRALKVNNNALNAYRSYGFKEYLPINQNLDKQEQEYKPYKVNLEYNSTKTSILQNASQKLISYSN